MNYIDVRLRIPVQKMGMLVELLPDWAQMVGYDKLAKVKIEQKSKPNGAYTPRKGTAAEAIIKLITKEPITRVDIFRALEKNFKPAAISSGFTGLRDKGIVRQQTDGRYAVT